MTSLVRFIAAPRSVINAEVAEMEGWRHLGQRMLEHARSNCPVGDEGDRWKPPHLKDTLEVRYISGADPRILIGSRTKGDILTYLTEGTSDHDIPDPGVGFVPKGGTTVVWARHVSGITPNPFLLDSIREIASAL